MNPALFTFEVDKLYPSLRADPFETLQALELADRNQWFLERTGQISERFAPKCNLRFDEIGTIKKHIFCLGAMAAIEAYNDAPLDNEIRSPIKKVIAAQMLLMTLSALTPDDVFRGLRDRAAMGFAAHPELTDSAELIVAHFEKQHGDRGLAEASLVGLGFAAQLVGGAYLSVIHRPLTVDDGVRQTDYIDQAWAEIAGEWSVKWGNPPNQA